MTEVIFWGEKVQTTSAREPGTIGAFFNSTPGGRVLNKTLDAARKIVAAGSDGLPADDVMRYDIDALTIAGIPVREENFKLFLDVMPVPKGYLTKRPPPERGLQPSATESYRLPRR